MTKCSTNGYRIRMIGLDMDGTLLTTEKELTEHTREVLREAIDRGVVVLPATGRPLAGIPEEVLKFPGVRYAVASNGARIVDLKESRVLYEDLVPYETGRRVLEICSRYDSMLEIYYDGVGYAEEEKLKHLDEYVPRLPMARYIASSRRPVADVRAMHEERKAPTDKVQALFRTTEECKKAWKEVEKEIPDIEITGALSNNIEVNAKGVNKGRGLMILGELLGIHREEIMAVGDGSNDIAMLREAGLGVAMENATEAVKAAADVVTLSNDQEGAAAAIEKYVLQALRKNA
ncbi:MAG TPA: Cof-type HAD-IIB family hydrolase [Lachnoclostridium phocaeense]|uniref:Cof-type HAD-IIB family hydrolase n=2 Tax=Lachnospiraceae TaxID=186803 RepID=A0A921I0Y6_9FIRM|nr:MULTISPECIES: Cof-type HAD-IIB family hydrolase [Lachnospiraceae]HJF94471.1 Cof-type HAD-IIB family hydrolase [Lachnoclostridium phocaeense]